MRAAASAPRAMCRASHRDAPTRPPAADPAPPLTRALAIEGYRSSTSQEQVRARARLPEEWAALRSTRTPRAPAPHSAIAACSPRAPPRPDSRAAPPQVNMNAGASATEPRKSNRATKLKKMDPDIATEEEMDKALLQLGVEDYVSRGAHRPHLQQAPRLRAHTTTAPTPTPPSRRSPRRRATRMRSRRSRCPSASREATASTRPPLPSRRRRGSSWAARARAARRGARLVGGGSAQWHGGAGWGTSCVRTHHY